METRGRCNKEESSPGIDFWKSAISIQHQRLCSKLKLQSGDLNALKEPERWPFRRNQSDLSRVRSLKQVLEPTSPKLTSIRECELEVENRPHRRLPTSPTQNNRSPNRCAISPTTVPKVAQGCFDNVHRQWLKETISTLQLDETTNKRSRSPTIKEFQRSFSRQACRDDFEVLRPLGRGRISNVYLVRHKPTNFLAALKVICKADIRRESVEEQIRREISIHSTINHPFIVQFYTSFEDNQNVYILSELAPEGQLYKKMQERGRFSEKACSIIIENILEAVAHLHHRKILHRDIKPENVVLVEGVAKLCDLGWSVKMEGNLRQTFCGTPLYASPELLKGEPYDTKHDLWAIGVLAYELFYGRLPFDIRKGDDLGKIVRDEISFPVEAGAPTAYFRDFVSTTLSKDPRNRLDCDQMLRHPLITRYRDSDQCQELL